MRAFVQLFETLDESNRTSDKLLALSRYFSTAEPGDAAWALYFLTGKKSLRSIASKHLRQWAAEEAQLPAWIVDECHEAVGDLSETIALILPGVVAASSLSLKEVVEQHLLPLRRLSDEERRERVVEVWRLLDAKQRFLFHKLISGSFRVGVGRTLVARALAEVAGIPPATMEHRLMGQWEATADDYAKLVSPDSVDDDPAKPFPFFLASPLDKPLTDLGSPSEWQAEWKWDGIRAQIVTRAIPQGKLVVVWSRGEELITPQYAEVEDVGHALPAGTVLDGEILAWDDEKPLPFGHLQRRIGRKKTTVMLWEDVPVRFMAYDLLEWEGRDFRSELLEKRRHLLESIVEKAAKQTRFLLLSPLVSSDNWETLLAAYEEARQRGVEGLMLKHRCSAYGVGRERGTWWKWKVQPYTIDAVLIYGQRGSGRRASLYTDYTFGVWDGPHLVPIAKAYSGLTDAEILEVDRFIRTHTVGRAGPLRAVKPELVFELGFEGIAASDRHKSGIALRFPRMLRWRHDKPASEADHLTTLEKLLATIDKS